MEIRRRFCKGLLMAGALSIAALIPVEAAEVEIIRGGASNLDRILSLAGAEILRTDSFETRDGRIATVVNILVKNAERPVLWRCIDVFDPDDRLANTESRCHQSGFAHKISP